MEVADTMTRLGTEADGLVGRLGEGRRRGAATRPAARTAAVAAFACLETERLGRLCGFPVAVIAAVRDPALHASRLSDTWHAAFSAQERWFRPFDEGLAMQPDVAYRHLRFDPRWMGGARLPDGVRFDGGCLTVELPRGASRSDFAAMFALAMADRQFDRVARRPAEVRRRFAANRPVNVVPRYAIETVGGVEQVSLVEDLYAFRPQGLPAVARAAAMAANGLAVRSLLSFGVDGQEAPDA